MPLHSAAITALSKHLSESQNTGQAIQPEHIHAALTDASTKKRAADQIEIYENLLSIPQLERILTSDKIADIHWDKALAHTEESARLFNDIRQPVSAFRHHENAAQHLRQALSLYTSANDRDSVSQTLIDVEGKKSMILDYLQKLVEIPPVGNASANRDMRTQPLPEMELKIYQSARHRNKFYVA